MEQPLKAMPDLVPQGSVNVVVSGAARGASENDAAVSLASVAAACGLIRANKARSRPGSGIAPAYLWQFGLRDPLPLDVMGDLRRW